MKRSVVWLILIMLLSVLGYCVAGPFLAIQALQRALVTRDTSELDAYVDFAALRSHLKAQMEQQISSNLASPLPFAQANALLHDALSQMAGVGVDLLMTPLGLSALLQGHAVWNRAQGITEGSDAWAPTASIHLLDHPHYHITSMSSVTANVQTASGQALQFVLTRHGLHWKLTNIVLPHFSSPTRHAP